MCIKKMEEMTWKEFDKWSGAKCFRQYGIIDGYIGSPGKSTDKLGEKQFGDMITQTGNIILKFLQAGILPEISSKMKSVMNHIEWR